MAGERAAIFGRLIEQLSESDIDADSRQEMYNILLEVLEEFEVVRDELLEMIQAPKR